MIEVIDAEWFQAVEDLPYIAPALKALRNVPAIDAQKAHFLAKSFGANPDLRPTIDLAEGNVSQLNLHIHHPEAVSYIDKGKYDLTIPEHRRILKQIGVIPVSLLMDL